MFSSIATNGEEPPRKKKKNNKASLILSSLPDDLVLSCLARISRLYYPTLSLASKKFQSLLASPDLYKVRSLLGHTENCLYVCLRFLPDYHLRFYTLCRKPDTRKKTKKMQKKSSGNLLVSVPSPQGYCLGVVAVGSSIYSIGGYIHRYISSNLSILDCRSHTWHQAPNMQVARASREAIVIDGKIYVVGGRDMSGYNSSNWIEVFDPKTQIWSNVSIPGWKFHRGKKICSAEIDGKICMYVGGKSVAYNPKDGTCEPIESDMCQAWTSYSHCVIDNVLFYYYPNEKQFRWFDTKAKLWRILKGLEGMPKIAIHTHLSHLRLADYGGKMAVLWDKHVRSSGSENKVIWCAVVVLERRDGDEIWGTVEWFGVVLEVPWACEIVHVLAATL